MKALDEIYKIDDTLLHRSAFKNVVKFRQIVFAFSELYFQNFTDFFKKGVENSRISMKIEIPQNFSIVYGEDQICQMIKILEISQQKLSIFSENNFAKVRKTN